MSSSSVENSSGEEGEMDTGAAPGVDEHSTSPEINWHGPYSAERRVGGSRPDGQPAPLTLEQTGNGTNRHEFAQQPDDDSEDGSSEVQPRRAESPAQSVLSSQDATPSIQGSHMSSPGGSSILPAPSMASRLGLESPTPSFRPFDRRFQSRLSSSTYALARAPSPAFLRSQSPQASINSQMVPDSVDTDTPSPPWEVVRWTKLKKLNGQAFSEVGKRNLGIPTCIAVSASIVLGTSKGIILIFDYYQKLKSIIGPGTKAVESGAITSLAISADHQIVAGGHANGSIFTWETARVARPFLHIPSLAPSQMINRTADGHVPNIAIRHLGFLGTRHTALVSADDRGMAFSHLATRGMGAVGRSVKTTRILGRYPNDISTTGKLRKPSTVLSFAPLPLGNVERTTDTLGLTAMLTPYLLVIVSTTPVAQTQHKSSRPKEVAAHSALSGCLAWFPAVKLKTKDPATGSDVSKVKLVYCWSNVLTVLDVDEVETSDKDKPSSLSFKPRSRWKSDEAIVSVQWLSRSVLAILTITQRLIILEDGSMRMTEAFDLVQKHIYHQDLFSKQLHNLVEQLDEEDPSMHGVVADAFYMSFKAYKSRMFLLGFNDVSVGTLSNWADRLIALMEDGDYIGAIQLATSYYTGDADKLTIGLPDNTELRHTMVRDKLLEIMTASLKFAFSQQRADQTASEVGNLVGLAEACFEACLSLGEIDLLFDEVYEWYEDGDCEGIFLEMLEPHILEKQVTTIPPTVVKAMVTHFVHKSLESRLEEMICHMNTATLDIDQITTLCKQNNLYDALIYVWNQALTDYVTPLVDLLNLLLPSVQDGGSGVNGSAMEDPIFGVNALKMFPYMSYTFTSRVYPTGELLGEEEALNAKAELYWFIFSGKAIAWPKGSGKPCLTKGKLEEQPSFPYLRMILEFDAPSFLSALNEAFEDPFLNDTPERAVNGGSSRNLSEERVFGLSVNRQYIITILLEVMNNYEFATEDTIYLDMFIARNLPKFPQYLLLSGTALNRVLSGLCNYPGEDIADDAQLSAEYLLSVYHPPDILALVPLFRKAGFYRVLKRIYKSESQYSKLLETFFEDPEDRESVFDCLADCLKARSGLTKRQAREVQQVIEAYSSQLIYINTPRAAQTIDLYAPSLHQNLLDSAADDLEAQYIYLRTILETTTEQPTGLRDGLKGEFIERYVQLMCQFDPSHVVDYVELIQTSDLRLEKVLPYMEAGDIIDASVILMSRNGQIREAMDRLVKHLKKLEAALTGLLGSSAEDMQPGQAAEAAEELLTGLQKYTDVGIWLCQGHGKTSHMRATTSPSRRKTSSQNELLPEELLWLDLIDTTVQITRSLSTSLESTSTAIERDNLLLQLRTLVQRSFTALLKSTSTPTSSSTNLSFLRILRAFLTRASVSSPNLSDLRAVLASIFSAYAYEESILSLANRLLDKDLFVNVQSAAAIRQRGWRPRGSTCEGCARRVWGPGVTGDVFGEWEKRQESELKRKQEQRNELVGGQTERGKGRAHARNVSKTSIGEFAKNRGNGKDANSGMEQDQPGPGPQALEPLVVLACRHIYHQSCLEAIQINETAAGDLSDGREFRCPIDG